MYNAQDSIGITVKYLGLDIEGSGSMPVKHPNQDAQTHGRGTALSGAAIKTMYRPIPENLTLAGFILAGFCDERTGLAIRKANGETLSPEEHFRLNELTQYQDSLLASIELSVAEAAARVKLLPKSE